MLNDLLQDDHERIGRLLYRFIDGLRNGKPDIKSFKDAKKELTDHIFWEEEYLFPSVRNDETVTLITGLEAEHGGIWKLIFSIDEYLAKGDNLECLKTVEALVRVLEGHNKSEEESIYLELEKLPEDSKRALILAEMDNVSLPEGWVCKILRLQGSNHS